MIIWVNGPFGAGKTTLSELLLKQIPNSIFFDPEHIGFIIHKTVPESRTKDFQDFPMWREHVILFAKNLVEQFGKHLIIPMTLVNSEYINEIHSRLKNHEPNFFHFFLNLDEATLRQRITNQVMVPKNPVEDLEIREWRLAQVSRCLSATSNMPKDTIFLDSGKYAPKKLADEILNHLRLDGMRQ